MRLKNQKTKKKEKIVRRLYINILVSYILKQIFFLGSFEISCAVIFVKLLKNNNNVDNVV